MTWCAGGQLELNEWFSSFRKVVSMVVGWRCWHESVRAWMPRGPVTLSLAYRGVTGPLRFLVPGLRAVF